MLIACGPIGILEYLSHAVEASKSFFEHPFQRIDRELLNSAPRLTGRADLMPELLLD
jgi:hypothetical protein